jgi:hypothetical protein
VIVILILCVVVLKMVLLRMLSHFMTLFMSEVDIWLGVWVKI